MVKLQPSKLAMRVRFPLPAPYLSLVAPASLKPPLRAALPRRYADPRSASLRSGIAAPASATAPPLTRLGAACAGGGCPRRWRGCGWNSLAVRSLASASGVALGVKIGGVLRGVLPRSSALRASGGGARIISYIFPMFYARINDKNA